MVHALETLQDAIYGELDEEDGAGLVENLSIAQEAQREEIAKMAAVLTDYVGQETYRSRITNPASLIAFRWDWNLGVGNWAGHGTVY
jgi:hypothetical protein